MKKTMRVSMLGGAVATLLLLVGYGTAFGQGQINFFTFNGTNASLGEVFQVGGVTPVNNTFSAQLYVSTNGLAGSFNPIGSTTNFLSGGGAGFVNYGVITLPTQTGYDAGNAIYYELWAWTAAAGSYATASITPGDQIGISQEILVILGGGINPVPQADTFQNLTLTLVPEPATCALMGLGGLSLLLFRRRK